MIIETVFLISAYLEYKQTLSLVIRLFFKQSYMFILSHLKKREQGSKTLLA